MTPLNVREKSVSAGCGSDGQLSPPMASSRGAASPTNHRHSRSGSIVKRSQNTKAAAERLARMMSNQQNDDSEDEDDLLSDYSPPASTSASTAGGRSQIRHRSPMTVHTASTPRPVSTGRSSQPTRSSSDQAFNSREQFRPTNNLRSSPSLPTVEHLQPNSARANRSPQRSRAMEQPSSARSVSAGRPSLVMKPITMVPATVNLSLRPTSSRDTQPDPQKNKRLSLDSSICNFRESSNQRSATATVSVSAPTSATASTSALEDDIDMLQEENETLLEKLRISEERCEEAEMRAKQLEKQAALKAAIEQNGGVNISIRGGQMDALREEAESARDEAASMMEQLNDTESEVKSLKTMFQRMVLTQEEMEELVLKRCWLSWYWGLCVQHGIHAEIASTRYEYWSSFAPLPVEVVLAAGQMAKEENVMVNNDKVERGKVPKDASEISGEGSVEKLSKQESNDIKFKQAWLIYFWRRVKIHGLEPDIVDERLQFWINQSDHPPTSHDAVDVERGLVELRKLGIEAQLWQASRKRHMDAITGQTHVDAMSAPYPVNSVN
ncbi:hypothetical protein L2E82_49518 [Cichorium intybus]|uniref:Uncharacterized protein n=1 Tax=Cichorium intybus TaxID=13427 RepID=A0ACB8Z1Z2_CICIN|nr:hypothetical protein L2E82_49518 [Cichorium intybus]